MGEKYAVLTEALEESLAVIKPGVRMSEIVRIQDQIISKAGYGDYFFHRVGHSILEEGHGPGPNIDNFETKDRRKLHSGHLFSIEPGIYLEDHGMRTEIDVLMTEDGPEVTTQPIQQEIIPLLK